MSKSWLWMATAVVMVVVAGGSVGVLADRILHRDEKSAADSERVRTSALWFDCAEPLSPLAETEKRQREWRQRHMADLQEELGLDQDQVEALGETLKRHIALSYDFWSVTREEYCMMRDVLREDVRSLLDEDQLPRFEERLERVDARARARYNRRPEGEPRRSKQR